MIYKETVKKIKHEMLLTKEDFTKLLNVSFATINSWGNSKYVTNIEARRKLQSYFEKYKILGVNE